MQTGLSRSRADAVPSRSSHAALALVAASLLGTLAGCSAQRPQIPPRPALPAVAYAAVPAGVPMSEPAGVVPGSAQEPPQRLSETGLFLADGTIDPRNRPFVPQYPLWSDGAAKSRWIHLPEGAKIDVSDIDANTLANGNQNFTFIGAKAFSGPGEIRAEVSGGTTIVSLNTDGDVASEMQIAFGGDVSLRANDFLL